MYICCGVCLTLDSCIMIILLGELSFCFKKPKLTEQTKPENCTLALVEFILCFCEGFKS